MVRILPAILFLLAPIVAHSQRLCSFQDSIYAATAFDRTDSPPEDAALLLPAISEISPVHIDLPAAPLLPAAIVKQSVSAFAGSPSAELSGAPARIISSAQIENAAGTLGDPSRYFQLLPGVLSDSDQRNDFLVRGGNPSENLFVIDNIEVPSINHMALSDTTGGFTSMLDNDAIQSMTLHSGVHDARFQDRLSSVVEISTIPASSDRARQARSLEFGLGGMGFASSRDLGEKGSYFVSARQSVLDWFTDNIGLNGVPKYTNGLLRADRSFGEKDRLWGMALTGFDSMYIHPEANDALETNPYDVRYKGWRNTTGINWQHLLGTDSFGVLTISNSQQSQKILETSQLLHGATTYDEKTMDGTTTAKYELSAQSRRWLLLSGGADLLQQRVNYAIAQPVPLPNPYSADATSTDATSVIQDFNTFEASGFAQGIWALPRQVHLTTGLRATHWGFGDHDSITPRVFLSVPLKDGRALGLGFAEYTQMPPFLYQLAFNQNRGLKPIAAQHLTVDLTNLVHTSAFSLGLSAYNKRYSDYPVAVSYPQLSLANIADTFGQSFLLFPMVSKGRGTSNGIEATIAWHPSGRLSLDSSLTYARSRYSGLDGVLRRGNFDIPLSGNVAGILRLKKSFTLSTRYSAASGRPYTPDNLAESRAQNRDVYDLQRINGMRSAAYGRMDFRLEQRVALHGGHLTWDIGLENALNQKNFYAYVWTPRANPAGVSEQNQMPRFPDGGLKFTF
jgi:hypothetical protein